MTLTDVVDHIENTFQLKCKTLSDTKLMHIKISGVDNCSLARWIRSEFDTVRVHVKKHAGYKFSDEGWITICLY